ncbi:MAG: alpha/beta fold hydrolase [Gammaproteobacteria bacterium]
MSSTTLLRSRAANGIAYHRTGGGSPVVLIHGVGLRSESWLPQIDALAIRYSVNAADMPGHGESSAMELSAPTIGQYADRMAAFIEATVGEPAILIGHSMGALIVLDIAARFPTLCRGVAAITAVYRRSQAATQAIQERARAIRLSDDDDLATSPVTRWFGASPTGEEARLAALCIQWLTEGDRDGYATAYGVFANQDGLSDAALASIDVPALFLTADGDPNSTPEMSRAMAQIAPRGEALVIEGARHMVQLTHPEEINAALGEFCARCDTQAAELR